MTFVNLLLTIPLPLIVVDPLPHLLRRKRPPKKYPDPLPYRRPAATLVEDAG
jgi:hypothetical protein